MLLVRDVTLPHGILDFRRLARAAAAPARQAGKGREGQHQHGPRREVDQRDVPAEAFDALAHLETDLAQRPPLRQKLLPERGDAARIAAGSSSMLATPATSGSRASSASTWAMRCSNAVSWSR